MQKPPPMMVMAPPPPPPPPPMMEVPRSLMPPPVEARPGLMPRERFQLAVNLLTQGDVPHAEVELKEYLAAVPNSTPARNLLNQIQTPIEMLYPTDFFTVTIGPNETLSQIAGVYMGDALAFYGLAKYNNIPNPSRITLGQTIKIPKTPESLAAQMARLDMMAPMGEMMGSIMTPTMPADTAPALRPPLAPTAPAQRGDPWTSIRADVQAGRFEAAIRTAEDREVMPDKAQAVILASAYAANARAVRMTNATEAEAQAVRAGQLYLEPADRAEDAIAPLALALEINPADMRAEMLLGVAKSRAADGYYRNGLVAFQRQDLDAAIAAWDKALAIDPNHRNAQLNRAQALELKTNLERITPARRN